MALLVLPFNLYPQDWNSILKYLDNDQFYIDAKVLREFMFIKQKKIDSLYELEWHEHKNDSEKNYGNRVRADFLDMSIDSYLRKQAEERMDNFGHYDSEQKKLIKYKYSPERKAFREAIVIGWIGGMEELGYSEDIIRESIEFSYDETSGDFVEDLYTSYGYLRANLDWVSPRSPEELIRWFFLIINRFAQPEFKSEILDIDQFLDGRKTVHVRYSSLDGRTIAIAAGMNNNCNQAIVIDVDKWERLTPKKRVYLIFHELIHDMFNIQHGQGTEIMYPIIIPEEPDSYWDIFRELYLTLRKTIGNGTMKNCNC